MSRYGRRERSEHDRSEARRVAKGQPGLLSVAAQEQFPSRDSDG